MATSASVKRLRSHSPDACADTDTVGPSPNTVKRLKTKAKQAVKQATTLCLSQQAIDAIQSVANNSQQSCSPDLVSPVLSSIAHVNDPSTKVRLQQQITELNATVSMQCKTIQDLKMCIDLLTNQIALLPGQLTELVLKKMSTQSIEDSFPKLSRGSGSEVAAAVTKTGPAKLPGGGYAAALGSSGAVQQPTDGTLSSGRAHSTGARIDTMERNVVTAIYEDQIERERRSNNVVVTGMFPVHGVTDLAAVRQLFHQEFNVSPEIKRVWRIGNATRDDKPKPIVVTLSNQKDADYLTEHARQLRRSTVKSIRDNVFLNRDLTRAEQQAAFVLRQRRREARKPSKPEVVPASTSPHTGVSHDHGPEPMVITLQAEVHAQPSQQASPEVGQQPSASPNGLNVNAPVFTQHQPPVESQDGRLA